MEKEDKSKLNKSDKEEKKSFNDPHQNQTQKSLTSDEIMWIFREIRV